MIFIGEKLNSSIPSALAAMQSDDFGAVEALIKKQADAGAEYIDVNTALCANELETMNRITAAVTAKTSCGIVIDTPDAKVAEAAAERLAGKKIIFNSVTATERIDEIAPLAAKYGAGIVIMPMDEKGIAASATERAAVAEGIIEKLRSFGIADENIYADAMAETLATGDENPSVTLGTIKLLHEKYPKLHIICGLSNISFGLPERSSINTAFLAMAIAAGLDGAICDVTNTKITDTAYAAEALLGRDEYCMNYITYVRSKG